MASAYIYLLFALISTISDTGFAIVARQSVFHHFPQPENVQVGPPQQAQHEAPKTPLDVPPRREEGTAGAESNYGGHKQPEATRQIGANANEGAPNLAAHRPESGNELPRSPPAAGAVGAVNRNDGDNARWSNTAHGDAHPPSASQANGINEPKPMPPPVFPGEENRDEASPDDVNSSRVRVFRQAPSYPPMPSFARPPISSYGGQRFGGNRYQNRAQANPRPAWSSNPAVRPAYPNPAAARPVYQPPRYNQPVSNGINRGTAYSPSPVRNPAPYVAPASNPSYAPAPVNRPTYSAPASPPRGNLQYNAPSYPAYSPSAAIPSEPEPAFDCPPVAGERAAC